MLWLCTSMRRNEQWYKNIFVKSSPKKRPTIPSNIISKTIGVVDPKRSWKAKGFCSCHRDFILLVAKNYIPVRIVETTYMVTTTNIEMILCISSIERYSQEVVGKNKRDEGALSLWIVCLEFWFMDVKS